MSYFNQKPNSFLASNNNDLRRDIAMNEIFDLKGKQNHQTSFFGNNQSQFTGSTAERSFLNLNVRDSLTTENIKYQTQPQHTNMFNNNIANHSGYSQPSHLAFKQPTQQSFLNYDSFNNNSNPSPNKLAMIQQSQQYQQTSFFDHDFDCVDDGADNFYYSPQFHMHSNELRSNMTQPSSKLQISKFKQEINGLLSNDNSRLPSNRDNQAEYFSSNLSNKRNNFKSVDGLYDTQIQHIGTFSHDNTSKATTDNNFGAKNGTKNYQKFSNLIGSAGYQKTQHENHSFVLDNQDDSFIFRQDKKKKNSRSSSILGDNFLSNQNQQYELNSSYIQPSSAQNTVRNSLLTLNPNTNQQLNQGFKYRNQYQNSMDGKTKEQTDNNSNDGGYKVSQDFAKKLRLQKCESTGDFQVNQFQQAQTKSPLSTNAKDQREQFQSQNKNKISTTDQKQVVSNKNNDQRQTNKNNSNAQTEESIIYIHTQETKSSYSTHNFDSVESSEKNLNSQENQQAKIGQNTQFTKQWEELNSFKKNAAIEEQKSKELTEKLIQSNSASKIDFKQIKLSRTPLQTIDIKQQLANIDQKAKLEAYGESMQPPEITKVDQFLPQLLQKNYLGQSVKTASNQDDQQQQASQEELNNPDNKAIQNKTAKVEQTKQNNGQSSQSKMTQKPEQNTTEIPIRDNKQEPTSNKEENYQNVNANQKQMKKNDQPQTKEITEDKNMQKSMNKSLQKEEKITNTNLKASDKNQNLEENKPKEQNKTETKIQDQTQSQQTMKSVQADQRRVSSEGIQEDKRSLKNVEKTQTTEEKTQKKAENQNQTNGNSKEQHNQQQETKKTKTLSQAENTSQTNGNKNKDQNNQKQQDKKIQNETVLKAENQNQVNDDDNNKHQNNQNQETQKIQNQSNVEQKMKHEAEGQTNKQFSLNLKNENQIKKENGENQSAQNSSRQHVDIQGIVQNIRSIKQDLQQKRNNRNAQDESNSKSSAIIVQTEPSSTPSFSLASQQLQDFAQVSQRETNSHIESLKNEIFSDFGKKGKEIEQPESPTEQQDLSPQENQIQLENGNNNSYNQNSQKSKNKCQMDVIEEEIRTKNTSQEQINTRNSIMSFAQEQYPQQVEEDNQIEVSFNGINNDLQYITDQNDNEFDQNNQSPDTNDPELASDVIYNDEEQIEKYNEILQQELSLDHIMQYQSLLNEASKASVKNLPLNYTKEMVNLAYCILQTVRNCSQIPKDSEEDQEEQF